MAVVLVASVAAVLVVPVRNNNQRKDYTIKRVDGPVLTDRPIYWLLVKLIGSSCFLSMSLASVFAVEVERFLYLVVGSRLVDADVTNAPE